MSSLIKTALVWFLALALPMQALAAAAMLHCSHASTQQAAAAVHELAGHHAVAVGTGLAHDATAHPAGDAGDAGDDGNHGTHGAHQCSACAACVAGAALPSAMLLTLPVEAAGAMLLALASRECSVVLAGLERPPRTYVA